jgi:hypothetical protein
MVKIHIPEIGLYQFASWPVIKMIAHTKTEYGVMNAKLILLNYDLTRQLFS